MFVIFVTEVQLKLVLGFKDYMKSILVCIINNTPTLHRAHY